MDLIKDLLAEKGGDLIAKLTEGGFSAEQAEGFVPEAFSSVVDAVKGGADPGDASGVLGQIDVGALASKVGVDADAASNGLGSIVPMILSMLGDKAGGLGALAGLLGGGGGIADKLGGLAGGLFGKK